MFVQYDMFALLHQVVEFIKHSSFCGNYLCIYCTYILCFHILGNLPSDSGLYSALGYFFKVSYFLQYVDLVFNYLFFRKLRALVLD